MQTLQFTNFFRCSEPASKFVAADEQRQLLRGQRMSSARTPRKKVIFCSWMCGMKVETAVRTMAYKGRISLAVHDSKICRVWQLNRVSSYSAQGGSFWLFRKRQLTERFCYDCITHVYDNRLRQSSISIKCRQQLPLWGRSVYWTEGVDEGSGGQQMQG